MSRDVKLDVYKTDGSSTGKKGTLRGDIFGIEPNDHVIWLAVTTEMANQRQGSASTKNRSAVRGGGRKPWRQKGRGTARAGTIRSPLWRGGGRIFGPTPKNYSKRVPKKMSRLARKSALTYKAKDAKIQLVEDFSFNIPKTRQMADILKQLQLNVTKTLLLVSQADHNIWLSGRNLPSLSIREAGSFSTYDVMNADVLLIQNGALDKINEVLGK
jgi:large subunit ribosomal protein L4